MTDTIVENAEPPRRKKGLLVSAGPILLAAGGGFATSYLNVWSPLDMLSRAEATVQTATAPVAEFVAIPPVQLSIQGAYARTLTVSAMIETDPIHKADVEHLLPRVSDTFNTFLSEIDPAAFDKRGVLEIIRAELVTRTRLVVGETSVRDVLITEFRLK